MAKAQYYDAKRMYTEDGLEIQEIATRLAIDPKRIYYWKSKDLDNGIDWEKDREQLRMTGLSAYKQTLKIVIDKLTAMATSGQVDVKEADALAKVMKTAKGLFKDIDSLGNIMLALNELVDFLNEKHPEALEVLAPVLPQFGQEMRRKYGKKS